MQLGYACINTKLRKKGIFSSRSLTLKTAKEKGLEYIYELIEQNLKDTLTILQWNNKNNIRVFRISSEIFPHISNKKLNGNVPAYDISKYKSIIKEIGKYAKDHNIALSFHATPYNVLGSQRKEVRENTIAELSIHGKFISWAKVPMNIVVHFGCAYSKEAENLWCSTFRQLPTIVKKSLVLENDERVNTAILLPICAKLKIPLLFDVFHWEINHECTIEQLLPSILATWPSNRKLKMHISEQKPNGRRGAHSDYVRVIPDWMLKLDINLMVEAKQKEKAVEYLKKKYTL